MDRVFTRPLRAGLVPLDQHSTARSFAHAGGHLALAVVIFGLGALALFGSGLAEVVFDFARTDHWILILGGFVTAIWVGASVWHDWRPGRRQYLALFGLALLYSFLFAPVLWLAVEIEPDGVDDLFASGLMTVIGVLGFTAAGALRARSVERLEPVVRMAGIAALVTVAIAVMLSLSLGPWFSAAMVVLAGGSMLTQGHAITRGSSPDDGIGPAIPLLAATMLLFWYLLQLVMA